MKTSLWVASLLSLVAADAATPPLHNLAALNAIQTHRQACLTAQRTFLRAEIAADKAEIADLDAATKAAMQNGDSIDDVDAIHAAQKSAQTELDAHLDELKGAAVQVPGSSLRIVSATYGPVGKPTDVAQYVTVRNGSVDLVADPLKLGFAHDPSFGVAKFLEVHFEIGGTKFTVTASDLAKVRVSQ